MLGSSQRMSVHVHRRETLGWPVWLSLALHLTLLLCLLIIPATQRPTGASEPLTVDFIVGEGPAATSEPPAAPEAPTAPDVPTPPPVQQAEIPTPAPEVPPPPPIQQPETPPPTPVQQVEIPAPAPDMPRHRFSKLRHRHQPRHPHRCLFSHHPSRWLTVRGSRRRHSVSPPAHRAIRRGRLRTRRPGRMPLAAQALRTMAPPGWGS